MGLSPFNISTCSCGRKVSQAITTGAPRADNFVVINAIQVGAHVVALVKYPDANNYEGMKIMLYLQASEAGVRQARRLDPHFCDEAHAAPVPFARFEPTVRGWSAAILLAAQLQFKTEK